MKDKLFILVCLASLSSGVLAGDEKSIEEIKTVKMHPTIIVCFINYTNSNYYLFIMVINKHYLIMSTPAILRQSRKNQNNV